jgi:hypothetical protein
MKKILILFTLCLFFAAGCGNTGNGITGTKQKNNAGTLSVILPGEGVPENAAPFLAANPEPDYFPPASEGVPADAEIDRPFLPQNTGGVIEIKEKMFIAQTNDVYLNPEDYLGKAIKLEGLFKSLLYEGQDDPYCFVLRYGPGCCGNDGNAGFEVAWDTSYLRSEEGSSEPFYPQEDDWVEALGVLDTYEEDGYPYLYISLSSLKVLEERGAEFVSQ